MTEPLSLDLMREDVAAMIHIDSAEIRDDDNLMDLGLDSMRTMNLLLIWQERGVDLDFSQIATRPTLAGWWQLAKRRINAIAEARL
ncbi:phosphopantetheine-binding protein [Bradyrhizobium nitroreducens]|uniref:Phosphopantetheine-binding protein n=1 Tax=Bradyrhizobium nitroreducens TaxID=709803 RepID=A0A2M6UBH6_9BRAD|nr:phosphopantetheine-binding protein [Bradyrhizobium nitroreducens]PIT01960.1 phosphopantetheine-binding protein [Bradyrhizobium nitroreducens]